MLACVLGRAIIFDFVAETIVHPDGKEDTLGQVIRKPQPWDTLSFGRAEVIRKIGKAIAKVDATTKARMSYGSMVGRALRERDERFRFMEYWVALEVLADGMEKKVTHNLMKAYDVDKPFVLDTLELRKAIRFRTDFVHFGKQGDFNARFQRLLQCLFGHGATFPCLGCERLTEGATAAGGNDPCECSDEYLSAY